MNREGGRIGGGMREKRGGEKGREPFTGEKGRGDHGEGTCRAKTGVEE